MSLTDQLEKLRQDAVDALSKASDPQALEQWRIRFLGMKGALKAAWQHFKEAKDLPADQRKSFGQTANEVKDILTSAYEARKAELSAAPRPAGPTVDMTAPGKPMRMGHRHIITQTIEEITEIFARMGFAVAYGPEVEDDYHNFVALNIPPAHPARDVLDNFYINPQLMLRSQTSTVQIRTMEKTQPPVRIVSPGRVYRPDTVDATHSFMFHQLEGLYVDEHVSMADLKSDLDQFCRAYFGTDLTTRLRPSFFPFTEPSAEVDVPCPICHTKGCSMCKQSGWIELGGCGMVDPNVLAAVGYDSEKYTGYAFGMGIERMIMRRHGITDIRLLFESDVRFLRQF